MLKRASLAVAVVVTVPFVTLACEHDVGPEPNAIDDFAPPLEGDARPDDVVLVGSDALGSDDEHAAAIQSSVRGRRLVFLNRNGGTYVPGADNASANTSSIIQSTIALPPYEGGNAAWNEVVQCVRDQFADYDIEITDVNPGNAMHIEMVLGGRASQVGRTGIWGVAPMFYDCSTVERAVGYVVTADIPGTLDECETAAHEIGHTLGLDHEYFCPDLMTYLEGCGEKTFQDSTQWCGEYEARACKCAQGQNTVAHLRNRLGPAPAPVTPPQPATPDTSAPDVVVTSPADGAVLAGDGAISVTARATDVDDDGAPNAVSSMVLTWTFGSEVFTMDCASPPSVATCTRNGDAATWTIRVGSGARSFHVTATDAAGNATSTAEQSLTLTTASAPPPVVLSGVVTSPPMGSTLQPGETFTVSVQATSSSAIASVDLWWITANGSTMYYALAKQSDGTFSVTLPLSQSAVPGERRLRTRITDAAGAQKVLADVVISVLPP